jgi:hypothetical protein
MNWLTIFGVIVLTDTVIFLTGARGNISSKEGSKAFFGARFR